MRDILRDIVGDDYGKMPPAFQTPTLDAQRADLAEPDTAGIMDRLNRGGGEVLGNATGTNAAIEGDLNYKRLQNERAKLDFEAARLQHEKDKIDPKSSDDPMVRQIAAEEKNRAFEDVLPWGRKPSLRVGDNGGEMRDVTPSDRFGTPTYGEARKEAGLEAVAGLRGRQTAAGAGFHGTPGSQEDIGRQRIQVTQELQKAIHQIDQDSSLNPHQRQAKKQAAMKRAAMIGDILSGKGAAGYFRNDFGGEEDLGQ